MRKLGYRAEATSVAGFVQQVAVSYVRHGYLWYVTGLIPEKKCCREIDGKLIEKYGIDRTESQRAYRKKCGLSNLQYIRHGRFFAILATKGRHESFWDAEGDNIRDIRRIPLKFNGYSISYRRGGWTEPGVRDEKWRVRVQIELQRYRELKALFVDRSLRRSASDLEDDFRRVRFEPYAAVRWQLWAILRAVNRKRKAAGFEPLAKESVPTFRRQVKPFEGQGSDTGCLGGVA